MQTPTHTLLSLAVLGKRGEPSRNIAVLAGSLIPDAFIYVAWLWLTFVQGEPQGRIWNEIYFDAPMQAVGALFNSVPIYVAIAGLGFALKRHAIGQLALLFALSALIHIAGDFPLHADDAHRHFWPVTDWRFFSPISYWDTAHHAGIFRLVEAALGIGLCTLLWWRFPSRLPRIFLGIFGLLYALMLAYGLVTLWP